MKLKVGTLSASLVFLTASCLGATAADMPQSWYDEQVKPAQSDCGWIDARSRCLPAYSVGPQGNGSAPSGPSGPSEPSGPSGPSTPPEEPPSPSDIRLKTDIRRVGTASNGLPLYQFRYKGGATNYEGVMAQDVLQRYPEAVARLPNGYLGVHYGKLGMEMKEVH